MTNAQTRFNGLSALLRIGEAILKSDGTLGTEVRKKSQFDTILDGGMYAIIQKMTEEERKNIRTGHSGTDDLYSKLLELQRLAKHFHTLHHLPDVIKLLNGNEDDSNGDSQGDADGHGNDSTAGRIIIGKTCFEGRTLHV